MGFSTIFTALLFVVLIYLHVKQNSAIFQQDIKVAKVLAMILLCILIINNMLPSVTIQNWDRNAILFWSFISSAIIWVLSIIIYWKIILGCYKDAFFKRNDTPSQSLRNKIKHILLDVVKSEKLTPALKLFIETCFEDPMINFVSDQCRSISTKYVASQKLSQEDLDKLKSLAEQLGEK